MEFIKNWLSLISLIIIIGLFVFFFAFKHGKLLKCIRKYKKPFYFTMGIFFVIYLLMYLPVAIYIKAYHLLTFGDLCLFMVPFVLLACFYQKDWMLMAVMPWAFIGGMFTFAVSTIDINIDGGGAVGAYFSGLSFVKHFVLIVVGAYFLFTTQRFKRHEYLFPIFFIASMIIYILIVPGSIYWITGEDKWGSNSTGLLEPSWRNVSFMTNGYSYNIGIYTILADITPYPYAAFIFYVLCVGLCAALCFLVPSVTHKYVYQEHKKPKSKASVKK